MILSNKKKMMPLIIEESIKTNYICFEWLGSNLRLCILISQFMECGKAGFQGKQTIYERWCIQRYWAETEHWILQSSNGYCFHHCPYQQVF